MSMSPGTRLDRRRGFQWKLAGSGKHTELLSTGRYRGLCGQVLIKTDLNQSFFSYLETSAIVAKQELKLSIKKEGFFHQAYLEELASFSCLFGLLNHYYNSKQQTVSTEDKMLQSLQPEFHYRPPLNPLHTQVFCMYPFAVFFKQKLFIINKNSNDF